MTITRTRLLLASLGGLAVAGSATGGVLIVQAHSATVATPSVRSAAPESAADALVRAGSAGTSPTLSTFRNGDYTATGRYLTPGGNESILVSVQVRDGVVTSAAARTEASSPTARQFQDQFRVQIAAHAVARPLASLSVSVVASASLTTTGFNDALDRIRVEAER